MPETTASVAGTERDHHHHHRHRYQNEKGSPMGVLSLLLKALIMSLLTSLFFLFLGLAAIIFLHLFLAGRHFHRRNQQQQQPSTPRHASPHCDALSDSGYTRDDLRKLPRFRYGHSSSRLGCCYECAVCLESFRDDQMCRSLPDCHHVFHLNCIDSWLVKVPACPLCRARVRLHLDVSSSEEVKQLWAVQIGSLS